MKKLLLSLGAMLVVGIASAQVNNQGNLLQTPGATTPITTTIKQDNTTATPKPATTQGEPVDTYSKQAPSAMQVTPTMPSPTMTNSMTNTPTSSDMSRSANNQSAPNGTSATTTGTATKAPIGTSPTVRTP